MSKRIIELLGDGVDVTTELLELLAQEKDNEFAQRYSELLDRIKTDFEFLKAHAELAELARQNPEKANKTIDELI